ncbi:MAG: LLM class flavin-dependent oxidoreductase [Caldilineaceae bacterium]
MNRLPKYVRLGFLTHLEGSEDARQVYREALELFTAADQLGFDVGWIAQHHFRTHPGRLPSPFPFLAAAAERTSHLRLGTAVVTLPLEDPLRVAEDAAVVDLLSDGRLELGIGSGSEIGEFRAFGLELAQRRELTSNGLQSLQRALRGEALTPDGERLDPPAPSLLNRLWQSGLSEGGVRFIAQQRTGLLLARAAWESDKPTDAIQAPLAKLYHSLWQEADGAEASTARIGLSRGVYLAPDKQQAASEMQEQVMRSAAGMVKKGQLPAGHSFDYYCRRMHIAYGNPAEVAETLIADQVLPYTTDLILQFNPVVPPLKEAIHMLQQIAEEVMPRLRRADLG